MIQKNKFSILFYLREDRAKEGKAPIYLRITVQSSKVAFPINTFANINGWDSTKRLARPKTIDADDINSSINLWRNRIYQAQRSFLLADQLFSAEMIKNGVLGNESRQYTLINLATQHNDRMKSLMGNSTTYGSYKNYKTTLKFLKEFLKEKYNVTDISLSQLNTQFISDFVYYLQTKKDSKCRNNGAMKHAQRLNKFANHAIANEWIAQDPFRNFKLRFEKRERNILTMSDVRKLEELKPESLKLEKVLDVFLFAVFTGVP